MKQKDNRQNGRDYLQMTQLTGDLSPKCVTGYASQFQKNKQKWMEDLNRHFSRDTQMAKKHMKRR